MKYRKLKDDEKGITLSAKSVLTEDDLKPENTKTRITTFVSGDVIEWLREEAKAKNVGYQTMLDMKLREMMEQDSGSPVLSELREMRSSIESLVYSIAPKKRATAKRAPRR